MLIKQLWEEFKVDFEYQNYGTYGYSNKEIVNILLKSINYTKVQL